MTEAERGLWGLIFLRRFSEAEALLIGGLRANISNDNGDILLVESARYGLAEAVEMLIRHGADIGVRDSYWQDTALIVAAREGRPEILAMLLRAGADLNSRNKHGSTAIHECSRDARESHLACLRLLLSAGADPNVDGNITPLMEASRNGSPEMIQALAGKGALLNTTNKQGTALIQAVRKNRVDNIEALLSLGADPNMRAPSDSPFKEFAGKTPSEFASALGHRECASVLERGLARGVRDSN